MEFTHFFDIVFDTVGGETLARSGSVETWRQLITIAASAEQTGDERVATPFSFSALGLKSVLPICRDRRYSRAAR